MFWGRWFHSTPVTRVVPSQPGRRAIWLIIVLWDSSGPPALYFSLATHGEIDVLLRVALALSSLRGRSSVDNRPLTAIVYLGPFASRAFPSLFINQFGGIWLLIRSTRSTTVPLGSSIAALLLGEVCRWIRFLFSNLLLLPFVSLCHKFSRFLLSFPFG